MNYIELSIALYLLDGLMSQCTWIKWYHVMQKQVMDQISQTSHTINLDKQLVD
jgi:hypothetical protein